MASARQRETGGGDDHVMTIVKKSLTQRAGGPENTLEELEEFLRGNTPQPPKQPARTRKQS
jgi:hypothetical protein